MFVAKWDPTRRAVRPDAREKEDMDAIARVEGSSGVEDERGRSFLQNPARSDGAARGLTSGTASSRLATLEATQGQILSHPPTDATSLR